MKLLQIVNMVGYQSALARMVFKVFGKKVGWRVSVNEKLAEELHKPINKKTKRRKVYEIFKANIWAADLTEMGLLSSSNKNVKYLLWVIVVFTKYGLSL